DDYRQVAETNAAFALERLRRDGRPSTGSGQRLLRSYKDGQAKLLGYLEDYAFLIDGLLALYEATFQRRWLDEARSLAEAMVDLFWDEAKGVFFDTGRDHESLVVRPRDTFDNATPSGSSVAMDVLLRLGILLGEGEYTRRATAALRSLAELLPRYPSGFGHWLCALDFYLSTPQEVAIVGRREDAATRALLGVVFGRYLPNKVMAGYEPGDAEAARGIPLLEGREGSDGRPTAYVCQSYVCQLPATEPEVLARQLVNG
ncbi:MAG: thioredoxin domain-containing protein, partial [Dehalococcoidia bacterium]